MIPDEFVLQLLQQSLSDLGYPKISQDLGDAIKTKRLLSATDSSSSSSSSSKIKSKENQQAQINLINWFNSELKAGNYLTIESYLLAVLQNIESDATAAPSSSSSSSSSSKEVNFLDILVNTPEPKVTILVILYLVRRISFIESYILQYSTDSPQAFIQYLSDRLMPLLDDLAPKLQASIQPYEEINNKINNKINNNKINNNNNNIINNEEEEFNYSSDNEYNFNPTISMSSSTADLTIIFGKSILSSLTREKESNLLLGLSIDIENLIKSSNDSVTISNFLSKYLFNLSNLFKLNKDNTNNIETNLSEDIIFTIRSTLIERILDKIFKLNDKLKSFDQVYNIPQNYLKRLIDLANTYQKQQNPYYLPPRTKFDREQNIDLDLDPFLIGTSSGLNSNSKHLNHFFKSTFFPNKLYHTLTYHSEEVWFTKFSPSGRFMISGSLDEKLIIYDVINNFKVLKILQPTAALDNEVFVPFSSKPASEKSKAVIYCCWDPQERYLVSCCLDTVVRVWYIGGIHNLIGKRSRKESVITGTGATTTTTTTNTTDNNNEFKLVSCFTLGQEIKTWTCEFLPTSSNLARPHFIIGSPDKVLKGFDVDGVELFDFYANIEDDEDEDEEEDDDEDKEKDGNNGGNKKIEDKEGDIQMRDETEDTNSTTTTNGNGKSKTKFDKSSSLIKSKLENKFNRINDITITPDGKFLITADSDHKLHFYKIPNLLSPESTTKRIASITLSGRLTSCSISKTGKFLLISCAPEELQVWDISGLNTGDYAPILYRRYFGHSQSGYIIRSAFGYLVEDEDEEQIILTGSDTGYIYFFKLHTSQLITRVKGHDGLCNCVDWNRFGKRATINSVDLGKLWSSVGDDNLVKIWGPF